MQAGTGLIATRFKMPSPRRNHLRREALFAKIDGVKDHLVTLVRGAAGSGKTTLLTSYIACRAEMPYQWLSLDEDLSDSLAFWRTFAAALSGGGSGGVALKLVEALLFKRTLLMQAGSLRQAADALREAVYYGCLSRILSPFLMEGPELAKPLNQLIVERGADLSGGEKLFIGELAARLKPAHAESLLSEPELEVLMQLATGASNKEIGERLYISLSTVKTHVINIYSKLEAASRVEAVGKARGMGLID